MLATVFTLFGLGGTGSLVTQSASSSCLALPGNEKILLFSRESEIRGVDLNKPMQDIIPRIPSPNVKHATAIDFDAKTKKIYWADSKLNKIMRVSLSGAPIETVIDGVLDSPSGFGIDYVSGNLFVTSLDSPKRISVATLDGEFLIPFITQNISQPLSLAVDTYYTRIFWSDIGEQDGVFMANMVDGDQANVVTLSSPKNNPFHAHPTSLSYDSKDRRLYWINLGNHSIQYMDVTDFSVQRAQPIFSLKPDNASVGDKPEALVVYQDFVYVADGSGVIYKMNKSTGSKVEILRTGMGKVLSLKIYDSAIQTGHNDCTESSLHCAHLCLPMRKSSKSCRCAVGYKVDKRVSTKCVGEDGVLVYSTDSGLNGVNVETPLTSEGRPREALTHISEVGSATNLDFHSEKDLIVWADDKQGTISTIGRDGTNRQVIAKGVKGIVGIAVDWVTDNLYWTNAQEKVIELCRLSGSEHFVILANGVEEPGAIAVNPSAGRMYWVDTGSSGKRIEQATLDGGNRSILVNESLQYPVDLMVDIEGGYLYWVDRAAKTLERVELTGTGRRVLLSSPTLVDPVAVFAYKGNLYWADK